MLETLVGFSMGAVVAFGLVGAPVLVLSWELRNRRILPPLRIEREKHPAWYWAIVAFHTVLFAFMLLVCGAMVVSGIVSQISN